MATLLLSAAGAALGGSIGGSFAGVATAALGKAVGATFGAMIDQRLSGAGSDVVETGRVERFRVMGGSEGAPLPRAYGRIRLAGQVIWSSRFLERVNSSEVGGKGGGGGQTVREYTYSVSLALALCEGPVSRIGRIWADGQRLDQAEIVWRLHDGSERQIPDPLISAIEGPDQAPAYRGTAYVVFEDLDLSRFGNRIPQFNFEVFRRPKVSDGEATASPAEQARGVALVPGTGEYALASRPVLFNYGKGRSDFANVNNDRGIPDLVASLEQMQAELPAVRAVSLVVSWFGDDLRCDRCTLRPAVEQNEFDGVEMPWVVSSTTRSAAKRVSRDEDRPLFGGTPADAAVMDAIRHLRGLGQAVMFYPFILMDIQSGNKLPDPWTGQTEQPRVPWRGRISLSAAPGRPGSPDKTINAAAEVRAFFGNAAAADFVRTASGVTYAGPAEWSYRRFILHYAHLCAAAGGVEAFCIGSEMRALTQIRDAADRHPAVRELCALVEEVRAILGADVKLGYAADWSEYFGYQPADGSGDVLFHLDPLWSHPQIDFVGIDNYMPLSDWRDEIGHQDSAAGALYNLDYLRSNVAGGEGYDWFYASPGDREAQTRLPIVDGAYGEDWIFRYKDIRNWWSNAHHNRIRGIRESAPTSWVPMSKPVWFTELGCPAVDKGTNQPNVFIDPKSSESFLPYHSDGNRDDYVQHAYLQAMFGFWSDPQNNPVAEIYSGRMLDMDRAFVWAWDARPWPDFPDRDSVWSDGANYDRGHWINSRISLPSLAEVVSEICDQSGLREIDTSKLHGKLTGFAVPDIQSARQSLQPLMLAYRFDSFSAAGGIHFESRDFKRAVSIAFADVAVAGDPDLKVERASSLEEIGRAHLEFVRAESDYQTGRVEAAHPGLTTAVVGQTSLPLVLRRTEADRLVQRLLSDYGASLNTYSLRLAPSLAEIRVGDLIRLALPGDEVMLRIDAIEDASSRAITAAGVSHVLQPRPPYRYLPPSRGRVTRLAPPYVAILDLPLLSGEETPHAPHVAVSAAPWTGPMAVYRSERDSAFRFDKTIQRPATCGQTLEALPNARSGVWMRRGLRVKLDAGGLQSVSQEAVFAGGNVLALRFGDVGDWEVIQFQSADLVAPDEYVLNGLLRGQAGSEHAAPSSWPAGSDFVLIDGAVRQLDLAQASLNTPVRVRAGPASRTYGSSSYARTEATPRGAGLRPLAPAHLSVHAQAGSVQRVSWIRRTRVGGDDWEGLDVPLGEDSEAYRLDVFSAGRLLDQHVLHSAFYDLDVSRFPETGGELAVHVRQLSARFGPGIAAEALIVL